VTEAEAEPQRLGHFRIVSRLGQGGMGVVYLAEDEKLHRQVALKVLLTAVAEDAGRRQRFLQEARSAAAVTHPNIATIYEVGEEAGRIFIAMELVPGQSLRDRMNERPLTVAETLDVARGLLRGLSRAHERGIVHRDLKPDNVMLTPEGDVKILDFGVAKLFDDDPVAGPASLGQRDTQPQLTMEGHVLGTPAYMAPEQTRGGLVDARTDVFAFGVLLHEILAGERPFRGKTTLEIFSSVCNDAPAPPSARNPDVPPQLDVVVARCLEKSIVDRYPSARDVQTALDEVTARAPPPPGPAAAVPPAGPSRRPRSLRAPALIAVLAVAVVGVIGWRVRTATRAGATATREAAPTPSRPMSISDHPPPRTTSADAAAAYATALEELRNASIAEAQASLVRAVKLDPSLAAGHLRLALLLGRSGDAALTEARRYFALASQLRDQLDERDRALLGALEPGLGDPPDAEELTERMHAVVERFPDDAECRLYLGFALLGSRTEEARAQLERAVELDPMFAAALWALGASYRESDAALPYVDRCVSVSPAATTCLRERALIHTSRGECAAFEADARHLTRISPDSPGPYQLLAVALAAQDAPLDSVREALDKSASLAGSEAARRSLALAGTLWTSELTGDLTAAEAAARARDELTRGTVSDVEHLWTTYDLLDVLEESGQSARELEAAEAFERRAEAWTHEDTRWKVRFAFLRAHHGHADHAEVERALAEAMAHAPRGLEPAANWLNLYGAWAETPADGAEALAAMPDATSLAVLHGLGLPEYIVGHVHLLAGQPAAALPWLREAARTCNRMSGAGLRGSDTIVDMRAHELLGEALEETGDQTGACEAYGVVLDRWRRARPRSVTLDRARGRAGALRCPGRPGK
jgi:serine/threonine-protein kinase